MAITFDMTVQATNGGSVTTTSCTATCSGVDRYVFVMVHLSAVVTSPTATYGGVSMTLLSNLANGTRSVLIFGLVNPLTGAQTVVVSWTGAAGCNMNVVSYNGVDQTSPLGTPATATGTSTTASVGVFGVLGDLTFSCLRSASAFTPNQTQRYNNATPNGGSSDVWPNAGTMTMSWVVGVSAAWAIYGVSLHAIKSSAFFEMFD